MPKNQQMPVDYTTSQQSLARKRAVLDALGQQALQQRGPQFHGPHYVGPGLADAAARLATAYMVSKGQGDIDNEQTALTQQYNTGLKGALTNYEDTRQNPVNARRAAVEAVASGYQPLYDIGMNDLKQQQKQQDPFDVSKTFAYADPESIPNIVNQGISGFKPKRDISKVGTGETLFDPTTGQVVQLQGPTPKQVELKGDLYEPNVSTGSFRKLDNSPNVRVGVNVKQTGEDAFSKEFGTQKAKDVIEAGRQKQQAQQTLTAVSRLEALNKQGVFSGPTANLATTLGQFANAIGVPVDKGKLGRSEEYNSVLSNQIGRFLLDSNLGRTLTDADRTAIQQNFAQLVNTPEGRQRIIGLMRDNARQSIEYSSSIEKNLKKAFPEVGRLVDVAPTSFSYPEANPAAGNSTGKVMTLDDYLKTRGQ